MKLKDKYKNIDYIEKMNKRIETICQKEDKDISELKWLKSYNEAVNIAIEKGWINTYSAIHLLAEKTKGIELHFAGTNNGILENTSMFAVWVMLNDEGIAEGERWYGGAIPQEYIKDMTDEEIEKEYADKVFIKVKPKDKETIVNELNAICEEGWQGSIILVEKS